MGLTDSEIREAMTRAGGSVRDAAALLCVSRQAVYLRLARAGVVLAQAVGRANLGRRRGEL